MLDIRIRNGKIVDGTGNPWFKADLGIREGKIATIGDLTSADALVEIDATGFVVSPGFIDIHTHSDLTILADPTAESSVQQGVTTEAVGQCGYSAAPAKKGELISFFAPWSDLVEQDWTSFGSYLERLERTRIAHNVLAFVGHSTLRAHVLGYETRPATVGELDAMKHLLTEALDAGAFGLTSGLEYLPGANAGAEELIALCSVVGRRRKLYASHIRDMNEGVLGATRELLDIGRRAAVHVHHSHIGSFFPAADLIDDVLALMDEARCSDVEVTGDATLVGIVSSYSMDQQRPSGYTTLETILPSWALEGGMEALRRRLSDAKTREILKQHRKPKFRQILFDQWDSIYLFDCVANRDLTNKSFAEIAASRGVDPYDVAFDLMLDEIQVTGGATVFIVAKTTTVENVRKAATWHGSCTVSDSYSVSQSGPTSRANVQPNAYGNYPCFIRKFVYQEGWLQLEDAVRRCTSFPAQIVGIPDRGVLKEGWCADVVVFDPASVADQATYEEPNRMATGIKWVVVNGEIVSTEEGSTGAAPGRVLRKV